MIFGAIVGLEPLCRFLNAVGRPARIVEPPDDLKKGFFFPDKHVIAIESSPLALVSVHMGGTIGPREALSNPSFDIAIGKLPVMSRKVLPMQYHWVVRTKGTPYPWLATKLEQETKGFFARERVGLSWTNKVLGPRFAKEPAIMEALAANIKPHDVLEVRPEPEKRIVRIVHKRSASFEYNLFDLDIFKARRDSASLPLIEAFEQMARIIQDA